MAREFKWLGAYRPAGFAWMTQDLNATGAIGDATLASAAKGEAALKHGAEAFVELLREIDRFDLAAAARGAVIRVAVRPPQSTRGRSDLLRRDLHVFEVAGLVVDAEPRRRDPARRIGRARRPASSG